jgi:hypothetical protein
LSTTPYCSRGYAFGKGLGHIFKRSRNGLQSSPIVLTAVLSFFLSKKPFRDTELSVRYTENIGIAKISVVLFLGVTPEVQNGSGQDR